MSEEPTEAIEAVASLFSSRIRTEVVTTDGQFIVLVAPPKFGKTSLLARTPDTLVVECKDNSIDALKIAGAIPKGIQAITATSWEDSLEIFWELSRNKGGINHLVIDGGTGLSEWCDESVTREVYGGDRNKFVDSFGKGDRSSNGRWQDLLSVINSLKTAGVWVWLICHTATKQQKAAKGNDYLKNIMSLGNKERSDMTAKYADHVFYGEFVIVETEVNKLSKVAKVTGGDTRVLYSAPGAAYEAGGRLGVTDIIELGNSAKEAHKALRDALKKAGWKIPGDNKGEK